MCRFLIVKSKNKIKPAKLLASFALACQASKAPDGELQKDGFGITWNDKGTWQMKKSLSPIWREKSTLLQIPETDIFVAHARSAGFLKDIGNIEYNQPFINNSLCFVFNGMIRKISLGRNLEGTIGSQKLFSLINKLDKNNKPELILKIINELILKKAQNVEGMNIGLVKGENIYVLCQYQNNKDYFGLNYYQDNNLLIISSEPLSGYSWKMMTKGELRVFGALQ